MYRIQNYHMISEDIMHYQIPKWASPYVSLDRVEGSFGFDIDRQDHDVLKQKFKDEKTKIRKSLQKILYVNYNNLESIEIERYATNYILYNFLIGMMEQIENKERKEQGDKIANDGYGRQHWIPRCYSKNFAQKISDQKYDIEACYIEDNMVKKEIIDTDDERFFCEEKGKSGKIYSGEFEVILSKMESDYGEITKDGRDPVDMWDFLILSIFFSILDLRIEKSSKFEVKEIAILALVPKMISNYEMILRKFKNRGSDGLTDQQSFPITELPARQGQTEKFNEAMIRQGEAKGFSIDLPIEKVPFLFAPYNSESLILFVPRFTKILDQIKNPYKYLKDSKGNEFIASPYFMLTIDYDVSSYYPRFYYPNSKPVGIRFKILTE